MGIDLSMDGRDRQSDHEQVTSDYVLLGLGFLFVLVMVSAVLGNPMEHTIAHLGAWLAGPNPR